MFPKNFFCIKFVGRFSKSKDELLTFEERAYLSFLASAPWLLTDYHSAVFRIETSRVKNKFIFAYGEHLNNLRYFIDLETRKVYAAHLPKMEEPLFVNSGIAEFVQVLLVQYFIYMPVSNLELDNLQEKNTLFENILKQIDFESSLNGTWNHFLNADY